MGQDIRLASLHIKEGMEKIADGLKEIARAIRYFADKGDFR